VLQNLYIELIIRGILAFNFCSEASVLFYGLDHKINGRMFQKWRPPYPFSSFSRSANDALLSHSKPRRFFAPSVPRFHSFPPSSAHRPHPQRDAPNSRSNLPFIHSSQISGPRRLALCFRCGGKGHLARSCP